MIKCDLCPATVTSVNEAQVMGWYPIYYHGAAYEEEGGPVCRRCWTTKLCECPETGEMVLPDCFMDLA